MWAGVSPVGFDIHRDSLDSHSTEHVNIRVFACGRPIGQFCKSAGSLGLRVEVKN